MSQIVQLDRDHESVTVAWEPVKDAVQYEVQLLCRKGEEEPEWTSLTSTFKANFLRKKNLENGVGYQFRLRALNAAGEWSDFSPASDAFYTLPIDFLALAPPRFTEHDGASITVTWDEVEGAEGYRLRWRKDEDVAWTTVESVIKNHKAKKNGLGPGSYYFSVLPLTGDERCWGYSASGGPFKVAGLHPGIARYLPTTLLTKGGASTVATSTLLAGKIVAFYFSAHWCGPCRQFTPQLSQLYTSVIQASPALRSQVEIVFCSADHNEEEFADYYKGMPWAAIDYDSDQREQLMGTFQVSGIPRLLVLGSEGQVLVNNVAGTPLSAQTVESWIALNRAKK